MGRGGKREGAGRKQGNTGEIKTKVIRVPIDVDAMEIKKLLSLKDDLKSIIYAWEGELHETSPRDESAKRILQELKELLE